MKQLDAFQDLDAEPCCPGPIRVNIQTLGEKNGKKARLIISAEYVAIKSLTPPGNVTGDVNRTLSEKNYFLLLCDVESWFTATSSYFQHFSCKRRAQVLIRWNKLIFVIAELLQETEERRDGWFF